jgi:outer membrane autotransporter protein
MTSGMTTKAVPRAPTFEQRWSVWGAGFGGSQTTDGNAMLGSNTATSRVYGAVVGADYRFSPFTLAGFALAGGGTNFSIANGLGSGRSDLFQAGGYIRHTVGPAYISAALAYGWQDITTDRTVTVAGVDRLRAQFNANAFSGRVEGGYRFLVPWMGTGLTPYAAGQFTTFDLPDYAESVVSGSNTFAVNYASKSVTASRSELGIRTDKSWVMRDAILTLRGRAAWAHDFNPDRSIAATFQTLPGASFVVNGAANARDAALTTASAEMKFVSGISLAASFEGEFSGVTRSYAGKGVARYAW